MTNYRKIKQIKQSQPTIEGAGVRLNRVFGYHEVQLLDPFLLLDDFHSDNPADYLAGFPWHPHRGIETITYMLHGEVSHGDSLGNHGVINPEAVPVQWMTAGSGIIHQEMPQKADLLWGFQLLANLPASHKMMNPRYRDVKTEDIPVITLKNNNVEIRVIAGTINNEIGPVQDVVTEPQYFDVTLLPETEFTHPVKKGHTVFAYIIEGTGYFDEMRNQKINPETLVIYERNDGDELKITTDSDEVRFLLISGKPISEPVAWQGPIVMNTQQEIQLAFEEYRNGTFIKHQ